MRVACRLSLLCVPHLAVSDCQLQQIWLSPPRSSSACRHLSNTFDSVAAAGAYLSWLPGGILISVQPQFSHTLSLLCPAHSFACPFAWHLAARSLVKMLPAFHKNCFSVVLATTLTRAASLIILYEFFITAAAIEILTFFSTAAAFQSGRDNFLSACSAS